MKISTAIIAQAVQHEMERWATMTNRNIDNISLPGIPTDDPLIKAALWFNFGMDVGKNLSSSFAQFVKRASLPVWVAYNAQKLYSQAHANKMNNARNLLNKPFTSFKFEIKDAVAMAAREYATTEGSPYADVQNTLLRLFKDDNFSHEAHAMGMIRKLIDRSGVINTDNGYNFQIVQNNIKILGQKLIDIYRGTKDYGSGGTHLMYYSSNASAKIPRDSYPTPASCSRAGIITRSTPKDFQKVNSHDKDKMAEIYANVYLMDVAHIDFEHFMPCSDTTYLRARAIREQTIQSVITNSHRGAIENLEKSYKILFPNGVTAR